MDLSVVKMELPARVKVHAGRHGASRLRGGPGHAPPSRIHRGPARRLHARARTFRLHTRISETVQCKEGRCPPSEKCKWHRGQGVTPFV